MNAKEYFFLTAVMRDKQKEYFCTRDPNTLNDCKKIEAQVDAEISRVNRILEFEAKAQGIVDYIDGSNKTT
jgi:hypothetical protein